MITGAGAGDDQHAAFTLQILLVAERVGASRDNRSGRGHDAGLYADDGYGLEFEAFHAVHGSGSDGVFLALGRQWRGFDSGAFQRIAGLFGQISRAGGDPDSMRLDPFGDPSAQPFRKNPELFFP